MTDQGPDNDWLLGLTAMVIVLILIIVMLEATGTLDVF